MRPASNLKLITAAAALAILNDDYRFATKVLIDSAINKKSGVRNIYLKGFGDPDLKTSDLDTLARSVKASGIDTVAGDVIADVSFFDNLSWGRGWQWDDEPFEYAAFISPLSVNDNCIRISVSAQTNDGEALSVTIDPPTSYVTLHNLGITVVDTISRPLTITRLFRERTNTLLIEGALSRTSSKVDRILSVWQPELYAATLFKESLARSGVSVVGDVRTGVVSPSALLLHTQTRRLDSVIVHLNKVSDNLSAENILKTISAVRGKTSGSAAHGLSEVQVYLASIGIDTTAILLADGSGLSFYNLLTAHAITQLLVGIAREQTLFPTFYASLPIAGIDGTLSSRMQGTTAQSNVRAKTGTLSGVSALSGYVHTLDGELLAFSILMQNYLGEATPYRRVQDHIAALLATFSRRGVPLLP
jgi:serine-type D-Ala-D-Ala carboxypeptidase/endopeptidase (penicillin-binding protein 4)